MSKKVKSIIGMAAPLAGLIPGIGLPLAVGLGAGGGLLSGGGLRGALSGGLGAGLLGGGGKLLGGALGIPGAAGEGVGGALLGAGAGGAASGLKGALLGGTAAGLGSYANAGGFSGLGDSFGLTGPNSLLGEAYDATQGPTLSGKPLGNAGSGILGATTKGISDISNAFGVGSGAGSSTYSSGGGALSSLLGGVSSYSANQDAEEDLLSAQQKRLQAYQPYVDAKFNPGDLTQDPGYQFRLQEGQKALERSLAAKGLGTSGRALKAAQEYGQGLADTTYNEAYNRWLQQNQQNIGVAGNMSDIYDDEGNIRATAGVGRGNILAKSLSGVLGGYGAYSPYSYMYS